MDTGSGKVRWGGYDKTHGQHSVNTPTALFILKFTVLNPNWITTPITVGRKTAGDVQGWDIAVTNTDGYINYNKTGIPVDETRIQGSTMTTIKHYGADQWCAPCRALKPVMQEIIQQNPSVIYEYIDVDTNQAEAQTLGIRSIPVVIVMKNGMETSRFIGIQPKATYEQAIK